MAGLMYRVRNIRSDNPAMLPGRIHSLTRRTSISPTSDIDDNEKAEPAF
jgi:hypothetical protein